MPKPATNRKVAEEIGRAYEKFSREELINLLGYITRTYVVDGTMPFNLPAQKGELADVAGAEKDFDFPKLIDQLKKRLPDMAELKYFQLEEGRVTVRVANQKITFGERVTSEFVPTSAAPPPPSPAKIVGQAAAKAAAVKAPEDPKPNLSESQQEALNDIAKRFKNLELD
jgi:hypothetical protein